jgi:hypothetical protein
VETEARAMPNLGGAATTVYNELQKVVGLPPTMSSPTSVGPRRFPDKVTVNVTTLQ